MLIALLILGMPAFGALYAPATALLSNGAHDLRLNQGLAFGMTNLAWAAGQAIAAAGGAALAQMTSDFVPYSILAGACLVTLIVLGLNGERWGLRATVSGDRSPHRATPYAVTTKNLLDCLHYGWLASQGTSA